jgi:hypothetical protein
MSKLFKKSSVKTKEVQSVNEEKIPNKDNKDNKDTDTSEKFILENININNLEKKYIGNEDMLISSLRSSPKTKKTKIKDILNNIDNKDFNIKQKKPYIKETEHVNFYISMNGSMLGKGDLKDMKLRCFHCHQDLNEVMLTVPIKFHPSIIKTKYKRINNFFEETTNGLEEANYSEIVKTICTTKKDRDHENCEKKDYFEGIGVVCSFECGIAHAKMRVFCGDNRFEKSYSLFSKMYFMMYKKMMPRLNERPMFCYELLENYGGMCKNIPEKISECRNTFEDKEGPLFKISSSIYQELKK